jgi:hypothetical protein
MGIHGATYLFVLKNSCHDVYKFLPRLQTFH